MLRRFLCADSGREQLIEVDGVEPLITLTKTEEINIQVNATGAILHLSHQGNHLL